MNELTFFTLYPTQESICVYLMINWKLICCHRTGVKFTRCSLSLSPYWFLSHKKQKTKPSNICKISAYKFENQFPKCRTCFERQREKHTPLNKSEPIIFWTSSRVRTAHNLIGVLVFRFFAALQMIWIDDSAPIFSFLFRSPVNLGQTTNLYSVYFGAVFTNACDSI